MEISRRLFNRFLTSGLGVAAHSSFSASAQLHGAMPSAHQIEWSKLGFYNFLHFTVNTFTDKEWGYGNEDPRIFNPTAFDADSIMETLRNAGSKGVILTCKHHDGFCLWPTQTTDHCIRSSPYRNGKGDLVREISDAAHRHGMKFGVYLSPWDRNQNTYGTPQYLQIYRRQMHELLTNYGPIFEIWHDGANGGDGYYGGAREKRIIDKLNYYDWPGTWGLERSLQPNAVIFSDVGPDVRWVGNEKGIAGETCWATYAPRSPHGGAGAPGDIVEAEATSGTRDGKYWMPAECDVSIRPGWFWHATENSKVKTPEELLELYFNSVGRGASFLLNVPPDRRGLIHENDAASLRQFGKLVQEIFSQDLTAGHRLRVEEAGDATNFLLDLSHPVSFDVVRIKERIELGQRIGRFEVETWQQSEWRPLVEGTSIGMCRLCRLEMPIQAQRLRLRITNYSATPQISEFALFSSRSHA
jgi:alpha-L-fucosidase